LLPSFTKSLAIFIRSEGGGGGIVKRRGMEVWNSHVIHMSWKIESYRVEKWDGW
jgi:hypothetical protein